MRINRYLAKCGLGSRRKCEEFIKDGMIKINGIVCTELSYIVKKNDKVEFKEKTLRMIKIPLYYKFNKPVGVISSMKDTHNRKDITYYLRKNNIKDRVFPIGRLDYDSEGLLILTNDGKLAHKIAHPKY
ncbi:MAG: pseudouridine synthase, partial [Spirochaetota bacterium]